MNVMNLVDWIREGTDETVRRRQECPDENDLADFLAGGPAAEGGSPVRDHLADCDHCLRTVAFLSRSAKTGDLGPVPVSLESAARDQRFARAPLSSFRIPRWAAAAAALVALTSVTIWKLDPTARMGASEVRGPGTSESPSGLLPSVAGRRPEVLAPSAGSTVSATGLGFRWTEIPTAVSYEALVVTLDGDVVWEQRVFGTETSLPAEVRLSPDETYLVRVRANLAGGKTLDSRHVRFSVRNP